MASAGSSALDIQRLLALRNLTKDVAAHFEKNLRTILEATAPLFRPRRFLGDHMEGQGKESVVGADQNLADLRALFGKAAGPPYGLRKELNAPLQSVSTQLQVYPWEYYHEINDKVIQVTAPLTWVITFPSTYSLSMFRSVVTGKQDPNPDSVRAFVLNAVIMHELMRHHTTLAALLETTRFKVDVRKSPMLGELPLVTVSTPFTTMRPGDDLVALAAGLAGGSAFEEVIDLDQARATRDPLRDQLASLLEKHGESL